MPDDKTDPRRGSGQAAESGRPRPRPPRPSRARSVGADLDALIAENADMRDRLLSTMADMENLRRRTEREKADTARYAISNFARDVLTVGDNLKRTIEHVPPRLPRKTPRSRASSKASS